jgi:hypothetical protein
VPKKFNSAAQSGAHDVGGTAEREKVPSRVISARNGRPIIVVTLTILPDAVQQAVNEDTVRLICAQRNPFAVIMDLRRLTEYPASQRQMYAEARERLRPTYERFHRLTVYLVANQKQRGFVTAVGWKAQPSPGSGKVFTETWEDSIRLCDDALA